MKLCAVGALLLSLVGCAGVTPRPAISHPSALEDYARSLMKREGVEALAVAVIEQSTVIQVAAYGRRNVERDLPLTPDTIMYGASLTKAAFAYMVLQLVDEGQLTLDASVAELLPKPLPDYPDYRALAGDQRWRALTPRIMLTHSTGWANFRWLEPDKTLRFHFAPGTRYAYSGEAINLLQMILEQGLGLDVGKEMQVRVFDRFGMRNTSMQWRPDFAANLADGYTLKGTMVPHDERSRARAAGSMDTTIADQARLWAGIMRGEGLSARSRAELVRPQLAITAPHQFPTLTSAVEPGNALIGLAAGLGVVTFKDASGQAWFKGGHNDSTANMVVCLEAGGRCVVMLSNDVRAERLYPELARFVLGKTSMPWQWEYGWWKP